MGKLIVRLSGNLGQVVHQSVRMNVTTDTPNN